MTSEMDVLNMDERQRTSWLLANRVTLMVVGVIWLGMIAWDLAHARVPTFLIAMVPVIAVVRFVTYQYYQHSGSRPPNSRTAS
jgi:hypothetical protein